MDQLKNLSFLCFIVGLILYPKHSFTRRLTSSRRWDPQPAWTPYKWGDRRPVRKPYYSAGYNGLAARGFNDDGRSQEDTLAISNRSIGGIYKEIPFQAGLFDGKFFRCGAVFVTWNNEYFFLTAASCVTGQFAGVPYLEKLEYFQIFVGATDIRNIDPSLKFKPSKIVFHPCYNPITKESNLAIIFVKGYVLQIPGKVHAARLPLEVGYPFPVDVTVSGFGGPNRTAREYGILNKVDIGGWDSTFCRNFGWKPGFFCVVDMNPLRPRGICKDDEGGPAIGEYEPDVGDNFDYVAGIISHVANEQKCQTKGVPALIIQTSLYLPWIMEEVKDMHKAPQKKACVPVDCETYECE